MMRIDNLGEYETKDGRHDGPMPRSLALGADSGSDEDARALEVDLVTDGCPPQAASRQSSPLAGSIRKDHQGWIHPVSHFSRAIMMGAVVSLIDRDLAGPRLSVAMMCDRRVGCNLNVRRSDGVDRLVLEVEATCAECQWRLQSACIEQSPLRPRRTSGIIRDQ